ncbi:6450_t:CDS:1, partial [Dentiscutata erythropus]
KYIPESEDTTNKMPPQKKRKIEEEITNLDTVKATKTWMKEIFKIQNNRIKGDSLEEKVAQILKAQNMITIMTKAHLLEENEEKIKLKKIIGDGAVDLFGKIVIYNQTLQ